MPLSKASNAVNAKVHAKYGGRLTPQNYRELMACGSVGEVATYLKTRTNYGRSLAEVKDSNIHRGYLEQLLRRKNFNDVIELCNFQHAVGDSFYEYYVRHSEVEQILRFIRYLNAGRPEEYLFAMKSYVNLHSHVDLEELSKARSFAGLCKVLEHTPYGGILSQFMPSDGGVVDYTAVELALDKHVYTWLFDAASKAKNSEVIEAIGVSVDLENVRRIYRLKKFGAAPDYIRSVLLPFSGRLRPREIDGLIAADSAEQVTALLGRTRYGSDMSKIKFDSIDECADKLKYIYYKRKLCFSTNTSTVLFAYVTLSQLELDNIIMIIEDVRYKLPPEQISGMLTFVE